MSWTLVLMHLSYYPYLKICQISLYSYLWSCKLPIPPTYLSLLPSKPFVTKLNYLSFNMMLNLGATHVHQLRVPSLTNSQQMNSPLHWIPRRQTLCPHRPIILLPQPCDALLPLFLAPKTPNRIQYLPGFKTSPSRLTVRIFCKLLRFKIFML